MEKGVRPDGLPLYPNSLNLYWVVLDAHKIGCLLIHREIFHFCYEPMAAQNLWWLVGDFMIDKMTANARISRRNDKKQQVAHIQRCQFDNIYVDRDNVIPDSQTWHKVLPILEDFIIIPLDDIKVLPIKTSPSGDIICHSNWIEWIGTVNEDDRSLSLREHSQAHNNLDSDASCVLNGTVTELTLLPSIPIDVNQCVWINR